MSGSKPSLRRRSQSDEQTITEVHAGGSEDIEDAVKAARAALKGPWARLSDTERGEIMRRLADLADELTDTFASIDTWNNGKRFSSAQGDMGELTSVLRYYAGFADKLFGQGTCAGAIYGCKIELPAEVRQFDYQTIRDVVINMRYTSKDGEAHAEAGG